MEKPGTNTKTTLGKKKRAFCTSQKITCRKKPTKKKKNDMRKTKTKEEAKCESENGEQNPIIHKNPSDV